MNKRIMLVITAIVLVLSAYLIHVNVKATPEVEYDIVTVKSVTTTHTDGKEINTWSIEYDGNIYIYTDLNYPVTTKYLLADISKSFPVIMCDIQTNCVDKGINVASRTYVTIGMVKKDKDGEVLKDFEIVEYKNGYTTIYREDADEYYNYISYKDVDCNEEDVVCTVCEMETKNYEPDDILNRTDKVIVKYAQNKS